jgi:predicted outer membrane repeat protein
MSASLKSPATLFVIGVFLIMTAVLPAPRPVSASGVLYAAPAATGSADCSSWANACTLQKALNDAVSGDHIWVKQGVHYPDIPPYYADNDRNATFTLKNGVAIYGGFAGTPGTEGNFSVRDWQNNHTILSGDIDQNDNHGGNYIIDLGENVIGNNAYHVVTGVTVDDTTVLDGFIISAGQANDISPPNDRGGGMYSYYSGPKLNNITFSGNSAYFSGGGMYNEGGSPTLTNVTFSSNSTTWNGGGMGNYGGDPTLTNVIFIGNSTGSGGGMRNFIGSPKLTKVTFSNNIASVEGGGISNAATLVLTEVTFIGNSSNNFGGGMSNSGISTLTNVTFSSNSATWGGGMYNVGISTLTSVTFSSNSATNGGGMYNRGSPTLTNVTFWGNSSNNGGGMYNDDSDPKLMNVTFCGNNSIGLGGGIFNSQSSPELMNVTFSGNSSFFGAGIYNYNISAPILINVTFSRNSASARGGGIYNDLSIPILKNVIMWDNTAGANIGANIFNQPGSSTNVSYSNIQGGYPGTGNINSDPLFVDADGADNIVGTPDDNLRLRPGSPAIDTGNNTDVPSSVTTDLDGSPRIVDGNGDGNAIVDMGAYEYNLIPPTLLSFTRHNPSNSPTNATKLVFRATFSKNVQNVDLTDFNINASPTTTAAISAVTQITPSLYEITVSGGNLATYNGVISLDLAIGQNIIDPAGNTLSAVEPATDETYTVDTVSPTVTLTSTTPNPTNSSPIPVTVSFSEAVTGFTAADITVSNGTVSNFAGSGTTYTFDLIPSGDGLVTVTIAAGAATDAAGNGNLAAAPFSRTYDATRPSVVSITRADPNPTNAASVRFTVTFSEDVTGVDVNDFRLITTGSISGANITGVSGSGSVYSVTVNTGMYGGTIRLLIPDTAIITDLVGNMVSGLPYPGMQGYSVDKTAPWVLITSTVTNPTNSPSIPVTVSFSEAVTGFTAADITVGNGTVNNFTGSGTTYTFNLIPTGDGVVTVTIAAGAATDAAGNGNLAAAPFSRTYDATAPGVVSITRADPNPTNAASVTFTVTFTEAVTGVGVADFALTVTGISGASVTGVSGSGAVYTVTVSTGTGDGTLRLDIPTAATITDLAGNNLSGLPYTGGQVYTVDKTAPGVTMTSSAPNPTNSAPIPVTVTFSEPVTGFTAGDIAVSNGSVSNFAGGGASYTFDLIPAANGPVTATIAANVAVDAVGNGNTAASFSRTYDTTAPGVTAITRADPNPTNAASVNFIVTFTEAVTGVGVADFALTLTGGISGASVTGVSGSGAVYTVTVSTGTGNGTLRLDIPNTATITDLAGNALSGLPYTSGETYQKVYRVFLPLIVR